MMQGTNDHNATRDFDVGFKHNVKVLFQSLLRLSTGFPFLLHNHSASSDVVHIEIFSFSFAIVSFPLCRFPCVVSLVFHNNF